MIGNIKLLIVDPDEFMHTEVEHAPLWQPTFLILLGGIFQALPTFLILNRANISGGLQGTVLGFAQLVGVISGLLLLLSIWLVIAVVLHTVTTLLGAEAGDLSETFQLAGWGLFPLTVQNVGNAGVSWQVLQQVPPGTSLAQIQTFYQSSMVVKVASVVGLIFVVWQGMIWMIGLQRIRDIPRRKALVAASIPVLAQIGFVINSLI